MDRSLAKSSVIECGIGNATFEVNNANVMTFIAQYATAFKLQGSTNDGVSYSDIAESSTPGDGTLAQRQVVELYRPQFTHIKAVMTSAGGETASVACIKSWNRQTPPADLDADFNVVLIDPILGTA
jgi:hypothetical protein